MKIYKEGLLILVLLSWAIVSGYVLYSWGHPITAVLLALLWLNYWGLTDEQE
jgi:hypothetical protein